MVSVDFRRLQTNPRGGRAEMSGWQLGVIVSYLSPPPRRGGWRGFRRTVGQQSRNRALPHPDEQKSPHGTVSRVAQIERRQK